MIEPGKWVACRILSQEKNVIITLDDREVFRLEMTSPARSGFGFYVQGKDAELRVRDLHLKSTHP